jgi:hypothetical protein
MPRELLHRDPDWRRSAVLAFAVLACAAGAFIFAGSLFRASSVDLGWHWALIDYIRANGHPPREYSPVLRVMSDYPPATHMLGTLFSWAHGSSLVGMHLLALLAIVIVYVCIACELPIVGSVIFGLGCLELGRRRLLIGHEIVENYFFAQLVATAFAVLMLSAVVRIRDRRWQSTAAIVSTLALGWAFPATAAVFGVSVGVAALCRLINVARAGRVPSLMEVLALASLALALIVAIVVTPYFLGMVSNASHDGTMQSWASPRFVGLGGLFVLCAALWFGSQDSPPSLLIPAAAGGFGLVGCVQWLALMLGYGSPYAVLKLSFGIGTFGFALAALFISTAGVPRLPPSIWRPLMAAPILAATFYAGHTVTPARDLYGLRDYAKSVQEAADIFPELRNATISANKIFDGALNWSVSTVALAAEYGVGVDQLGAFGYKLQPDERSPGARFAALPLEQAAELADDCHVHRTASLAIVKLECANRITPIPPRY